MSKEKKVYFDDNWKANREDVELWFTSDAFKTVYKIDSNYDLEYSYNPELERVEGILTFPWTYGSVGPINNMVLNNENAILAFKYKYAPGYIHSIVGFRVVDMSFKTNNNIKFPVFRIRFTGKISTLGLPIIEDKDES